MVSTAHSARTVHVPVEALFYILDAIVDPSDDGLSAVPSESKWQ
jgi:hypothetical protein